MSRTSFVFVAIVVAVAVVVSTGCGRRRAGGGGPGPVDSGPVRTLDAGSRDSGRIVLMDAGPTTCTPPCGLGEECRSGTCVRTAPSTETICDDRLDNDVDGATDCADSDCAASAACRAACRSFPISHVTMSYCAASTATCTEGCSDGACVESCLMADVNPDCWNCALNNLLACLVSTGGCQSEYDCLNTCGEDNCPTGSSSTCIDTSCASELAAWRACSDSITTCGTTWTDCL